MSKLILPEDFRPNNYHHNEYNFQRTYAENILNAQWHLTLLEWCQYFLEREYLRDLPPVTTDRWLTRISHSQPFEAGNIRVGTGPENGKPLTTTYKATNGKYEVTFISSKR